MNIEELKRKYTPQSWESAIKKIDYNETVEKLGRLLKDG